MKMHQILPAILVIAVVTIVTEPGWAQFGNTGAFGGQSGIGSTNSLGGGGSGTGIGAIGLSGATSQLGTGAIMNFSGLTGPGMGNVMQRNSTGLGVNNQAGGMFGGNGMTGLGMGMGMGAGMNSMGFGGFGLGGMGRGGFGRNSFGMNQNNNRNQNNARANLRTTVRVADTVVRTPAVTTQVASRLQTRFTRIPRVMLAGDVTVAMDGGTAVLSGVVATAEDRDLLGRLAMLEPGVSEVRNELGVDPAAAKPEPLPTGAGPGAR